ncbi:MAG TPA: polysaccharide biosynthesis/export family protein [Sphingomicrobium sp.]|nr:polysaccharide biosynthesis/export family protein [Sphingomicrobium sp.]
MRPAKILSAIFTSLALAACASLGASGPETSKVRNASDKTVGAANIQIVHVDDAVARRVLSTSKASLFSEAFGADVPPESAVLGKGDVLQLSIWEAPPAVLFGSVTTFGGPEGGLNALAGGIAQQNSIPEMMVDEAGTIKIPFAGTVRVEGSSLREVEREIARRLAGKAHDPQVSLRIVRNASATVTLVGDVANNTQVPLTPKGERLLDAIASVGGLKTPMNKTTIQITRNGRMASLPFETIIHDPSQNILLRANDVITAVSQSFSFTALGETGASAEVPFESTGITLAQALGRVGGLKSDRADPDGVFIFRLEDPAAVDPSIATTAPRTPDGRIPVIYAVNLKNPASFFVAQSFPVRDKDVMYVSRAPLSDLQRFVAIIASMTFPIYNVARTLQ